MAKLDLANVRLPYNKAIKQTVNGLPLRVRLLLSAYRWRAACSWACSRPGSASMPAGMTLPTGTEDRAKPRARPCAEETPALTFLHSWGSESPAPTIRRAGQIKYQNAKSKTTNQNPKTGLPCRLLPVTYHSRPAALIYASTHLPFHKPRRPWRPPECDGVVIIDHCFAVTLSPD